MTVGARFLDVVSLAIEELPSVIKEDVEDSSKTIRAAPAARLRPRMGMVGDIWLAFIGPEVRRGASGLGETAARRSERFQSALHGAAHFSKRLRTARHRLI